MTTGACTCARPRLDSINHCRTCGLVDIDVVRSQVMSKVEAERETRARRTPRVAAIGPSARPDGDVDAHPNQGPAVSGPPLLLPAAGRVGPQYPR